MFAVYMKDNSGIFYSGFLTWEEAENYGRLMFGPKNFEIEREN